MSTSPLGPVRTCVGCRERGARSDLLRVVLLNGTLAVDEHGHLPGRGARIHPNHACIELADKRRAFTRALRLQGQIDAAPLREWLAAHAPR